ncbi:putative membrane protein [Lachnotalea glycerini]|jgi:uncharacterized membrane protein|uniref:Putative membrane protein n=1 Tax=Lachnotalea glycerini TaxID=1763509 RepID=A0A255QPT1_9FIRM|nr:QueT transporter family protein [Lachnotalea glycerini]OYP30463.1 transporter [Lachnotalea glycerini]PXV89199.1 putative membrane protein [Lachnotalea glycerini]RDY31455.1 QueT transporter family protein [Lachnotalea glycerini]
MKTKNVQFITHAAAIAAIYVVMTVFLKPLSFDAVQIRFAEALTILPFFTPAAIPGLFIGCLLGNFLGGAVLIDVIFGSLATLLAAGISYSLRKYKFLVPIPPILANMLVVPFILKYAYGVPLTIMFMILTVGIGEFISCGVIGTILLLGLEKYKYILFRTSIE